jgi:multiple sugar transport system ATP-binding protein
VEAMTMGDRIVVMKDGIIQQIDVPLKLYNEPVNLFVAGFLGSPPMNFVKGRLKETNDGFQFKETEGGTIELKFPERPELKPYAGKEVILGLRPEDIEFTPEVDKSKPNRFQGVVDVIEPLGAETYFYVQTGGHTVTSRSHALIDHNEAGRRLQFEVKIPKMHFFDPETTARIT